MKRTKTTELPYVTLRIPLPKFIQLVQNRFSENIEKFNLVPGQEKYLQTALKNAFNNILAEKFVVDGIVELVQFPLGSLAASGKFFDPDAGQIVYVPGTGTHRPYIRKWVKPPKINSDKQQAHRTLFKQVAEQWRLESDEIKSVWNQDSKTIPGATGQTLYIKAWFKIGKDTGGYPGLGFVP
jgi:hypothetical protein